MAVLSRLSACNTLMITLISRGVYRLVVSKDKKNILYLGDQGYLWSHVKGIGELLSFSKHAHESQYVLAQGIFRIYSVKREPAYVDLQHLELAIGARGWQGYLLLTGLPTERKIRSRIVPTEEVIGSIKKAKRA